MSVPTTLDCNNGPPLLSLLPTYHTRRDRDNHKPSTSSDCFFTWPGLCVRISMWNLVSSSVLPDAFTTRSFTPSGLSTPCVCMV